MEFVAPAVPERAVYVTVTSRPTRRIVIGRDRDHVPVEDVDQRVAPGDDLDLVPLAI